VKARQTIVNQEFLFGIFDSLLCVHLITGLVSSVHKKTCTQVQKTIKL